MQPKEFIDQTIKAHKVVIFSKSYCPFCKKVKELFDQLNEAYFSIELNQRDDGKEIQDELYNLTSQKTVPNVFINGKHIGGCDTTYELYHSRKLEGILQS